MTESSESVALALLGGARSRCSHRVLVSPAQAPYSSGQK
jgi:hypothetical protein